MCDVETGKTGLATGQFYSKKWIIYSALGEPSIDLEKWRLNVTGLVEHPVSHSYSQLLTLEHICYTKDFNCVTRWSIKDVSWKGVSLKALIQSTGPKPSAEWVVFRSLDGYTTPVPIQDALSSQSMVVLEMNGEPLKYEQGFPARPFIPHLYGWKSAKWLTEIRLTDHYIDGYWERYGYHERGNVFYEERFKGDDWKKIKKRTLGSFEA
jgi:DMSO/TMAO reductase YedYZ molybdopterin-dependent catalytic subunit